MTTLYPKQYSLDRYKLDKIMSAGKIQTMVYLLEKAKSLILEYQENVSHTHSLFKAQDIIAQLQWSLNYRNVPECLILFELLDLMWLGLEKNSEKSVENTLFCIDHFLETLRFKFRV